MGLDVSHDAWSGPYSRFNRFRTAVAKVSGYSGLMEESIYSEDCIMGEWSDGPPHDMILMLLIHADCDGIIKAEYCAALADRLEQIAPSLRIFVEDDELARYDEAVQFIAGLRAAAAAGENLEFR